jgi:hypothetical protein
MHLRIRLYYDKSLIIQILRDEENVNELIGTDFAYCNVTFKTLC